MAATRPSLTKTLTSRKFHIWTRIEVSFVLLESLQWDIWSDPSFNSIQLLWFFSFSKATSDSECFWSHIDHSSPLMRFWVVKSFINQLASDGIYPSPSLFQSNKPYLDAFPWNQYKGNSMSPHREVLVLLSRMISSGSLSKYLGWKVIHYRNLSNLFDVHDQRRLIKLQVFNITTKYLCMYAGKSRRKTLFPIFSNMVNGT